MSDPISLMSVRAPFALLLILLAASPVSAQQDRPADTADALDAPGGPIPAPEVAPPPPRPPPVVYGPRPIYQPVAARPLVYGPGPVVVSRSERLPDAAPFMLGFGLSVLGAFALTSTTVLLADADLSGINGEGVLAIAGLYLVGGILAGGGAYMALGSLCGEVSLHSHQPGWVWFAAITSLLGGLSMITSVSAYFVDDDFGEDTLGFAIASGALYLLTLTAIIGLDNDGTTTVAVAPLPVRDGAGLNVLGRF